MAQKLKKDKISVKCSQCGAKLLVPDIYRYRSVKCPRCKTAVVIVPEYVETSAKQAAQGVRPKTSPSKNSRKTDLKSQADRELRLGLIVLSIILGGLIILGLYAYYVADKGWGLGLAFIAGVLCAAMLTEARSQRTIICPNPKCGYQGLARRKARGNLLIGLLLCLFFIVPGLIYFAFKSGYRYYCPQCGIEIGSDV